MKFINSPETALQSLTISQAKLAIPAIFGHLFTSYEYERQGHSVINGCDYDIYLVNADGNEYTYYEDISAFYGKGNIIPHLTERDLPDPNELYPLEFVLGSFYKQFKDYGLKRGIDLDLVKVKFKRYASNMVSNYIAAYYPDRNEIDVTTVKEYDKTFDFPILHSFNLYKLFVLHQVVHIVYQHDFMNTEIDIKGNYYQPKLGVDCIDFQPLKKRTHLNEFLNYMFWLHKPGAFKRSNEKSAFLNSALFGIKSNLFTFVELQLAIIEAKPDIETKENLLSEIDFYKTKF